jgi:hypothetical protein
VHCSSVSLACSLLMFCLQAPARWIAVCLKMDSCSYRSLSISCWTLANSSSAAATSSSSASLSQSWIWTGQALHLLETCVLAKAPAGLIGTEPLRRSCLSWRRHCSGWTLPRRWMRELVGGVALRGYFRSLGVLVLWR